MRCNGNCYQGRRCDCATTEDITPLLVWFVTWLVPVLLFAALGIFAYDTLFR